jgi:hypothetical protein
MNPNESCIGIFWYYQSEVICKKLLLADSKKDSLGIFDCPFQHIQEWEDKHIFLPKYPELFGSEYQELPRGRVVYLSKKNLFVVYADKTCLNKKTKQQLIDSFDLPTSNIIFKSDPHYKVYKY